MIFVIHSLPYSGVSSKLFLEFGGGGLLVFIDKRRYSVCGTYTPVRES